MLKKIIITMLIMINLFTNMPVFAGVNYGLEYSNQVHNDNSVTFKDVTKNHWAYDYISEMVNRGILSGYPDGRFYPDNTISRAEFAKVMVTSASLQINNDEVTYYEDVKISDWFRPYVNVARPYLSGYTNPYSGNYYYPNQPVLREDVGVSLVKLKGYETFGFDESMLNIMFSDVDSISIDARKYIATAIEKGIMSGYEDRTFRGQSSVTRAEAAAMLWRAYQYGNNNKEFGMMKEAIEISSNMVPTINSKVEVDLTPEPTSKLTDTPTPESEKEYVVERITEVDKNNYMTYNSGENIIYYYKNDVINKYDVDSGKNSVFMDCSEFKFTADNGNYYKNLKMEQMYYDNYRNRLYITMNATKKSDIGGLEDVACNKELHFYITNNEISEPLKKGYIFGTCKEGTIGLDCNGIEIFNPDTSEVITNLGSSSTAIDVIINNNCEYMIKPSYNNYTSASLIRYNFSESETIRSIAVASRYGVTDNNFYIWDIKGRIIKCDLDGNLSVLLDVNTDVKIKDMMNIKSCHSNNEKFIITDDDNIIFYQDNYLRIIRKVA